MVCEWGTRAKGICRLQELNRTSAGGSLGGVEECVEVRGCPGWRAGGQAQMRENLDDHGGIFNGGEDGQGASALRARGEVDGEDAFE